ncbi:MAG: ExbD/TolR family protein [Gammaproteobacteria bacterium]
MDFRRGRREDYPEINLIPFIDILLVIVIFLAVTTTYARFAELRINLPTSSAEQTPAQPKQIEIAVSEDGRYAIDNLTLADGSIESLAVALQQAAGEQKDPVVVINADARAAHQSVVNVMEAARRVGLARITFATQTSP